MTSTYCIMNIEQTRENIFHKYICRLFHLLEQLPFTTSETELDYYQQRVNVRVASQVGKWLKAVNLRRILGNLGILRKISKIIDIQCDFPVGHLKYKF